MKRDVMRLHIPHINVPPPQPPVRDKSKTLEYFESNPTYTEGTSPLKRHYRRTAPPPHPPQSCGQGEGGGGGGVLLASNAQARPLPQGGGQGGGGGRGLRRGGSEASIVYQLYSQINPSGPKVRDETRETGVRGAGGGVVARMWTAVAGMYLPPHMTCMYPPPHMIGVVTRKGNVTSCCTVSISL